MTRLIIHYTSGTLLVFLCIFLTVSCGKQDAGEAEMIWHKPTKSFGEACTQECAFVASFSAGHGRTEALAMLYDPALDDEIAQWGDCLQSVMRCTVSGGDIATCTTASACPARCIAAFTEKSGDRQSAFEAVFINDGGLCVPEGKLE